MPALNSKVALLSFDDRPPIGGQGRYAGALEQQLPEQGFSPAMVTARRLPDGSQPRIPRRTRRAPLDYSLWLRRRLPEIANAVQPDLWHAMGGPGGVLLFRHPPSAPLVYTAHHTYRTAHGRRLATRPLGSIEGRAYRFAEHVIAVSDSTAASLAHDYEVPSQRISVIPIGVEADSLAPNRGFSERDTLLFVGRLVPIKGLPQFLALFRELQERWPELRAEVCGAGPLESFAREAAGRSSGRLEVRGRVSEEELAESYRRARLVVVPSRFEGLGMVPLEALAAGAPVLATDVPGLTDLRGEGVVLVPPDDPVALLAAAQGMLSDRAGWQELSEAGRRRIEEGYTWEALGPRIAEVYRSVLASKASQLA